MNITDERWKQFKKNNVRNLSILDAVFPKIKPLTKGGRLVVFSFERGHPVMRTFPNSQNLRPFINGWRGRLANYLFALGDYILDGGE